VAVNMSDQARRIYEQEEVAKFMATSSNDGDVNVALIVTQVPVEADRIVFGEWMMVKTKKNLIENPRFASLAMTQKLQVAGFKADVDEWVTGGPYVDRINSLNIIRYNAYMGLHNVAIASIKEMLPLKPRVSYQALLGDFLALRTFGRLDGSDKPVGVDTPPLVREKFNSLISIKVLAFLDADGYPGIAPVMTARFHSPGRLVLKISSYNRVIQTIGIPARVALNVMTMDMKTYQLKGELVKLERSLGVTTGVVRVDEVYSSMPPFIGERLA